MTPARFLRGPVLLLMPLVLGACLGSAPPLPRDQYYRILLPPPPVTAPSAAYPGVVTVARLEADGLLRERPLLFSADGGALGVQQHDYYYWTDPPTRLIQGQIVALLQKSGLARTVVTPEMPIRPDYEVRGRINRLERLLGDGPPRVVAELKLAVVDLEAGELMLDKTYAAELPSADDSVDAAIAALNRALADILARFLADAFEAGPERGLALSDRTRS